MAMSSSSSKRRKGRRLAAAKASPTVMAISAPVKVVEATADAAGKQTGPATFAATAYSGAPLPGYVAKLDKPVVIDLAGMKPARNLVANLDHQKAQRVGHVTTIDKSDGKQLRLEGSLSAATPHRDEVVNSAKDGFSWEVSIETELTKLVSLASGQTAEVNGRTVKGPLWIARKSTLLGLAFVGQGADEGNTVRVAAAKKTKAATFEAWCEAKNWDLETLEDDQVATLRAAYEAERNPPTADGDEDPSSLEAIMSAERRDMERRQKIQVVARRACRQYGQANFDVVMALAQRAEQELWDADKLELALLRQLGPQSGDFGPRQSQRIDGRVVEAALCLASRLPDVEKMYPAEILEAADQQLRRGLSLQRVLLMAATANGYDAQPGERILTGNLESILAYAFPDPRARQAHAAFSTISLPNILGAVANKEILAGFMEEDMTWKEISAVKSVSNFHQVTSYRMTDDLEYEELSPTGEIRHGTLGEESYTRQAKTYAKMLGISRTDIINDDLGAFGDLRNRLGRGAARKMNTVFWTKFLDDAAFFTTARANYFTGANTTLASSFDSDSYGLGQGVKTFRQLESSDGKRIGGRPEILLVPPELEQTARRLYMSSGVNAGGSASSAFVPDSNVFGGLYRPVVADQLSDSSYTGYSATAWYLLRNPAILAAMVVSFLNGQMSPTVESTNADFNTLGIQFRGFHDFGCDQAEYLAGVKSKGAA